MSDIVTTKIRNMVRVAEVLGAPHFNLEDLLAGAEEIDRRRTALLAEAAEKHNLAPEFAALYADTTSLDRDMALVERGAQEAFSWIVGHQMLPPELDTLVDRDDRGTKPLGIGWRAALKYLRR